MKVSARLVRDSPKKVSSQNLEIFYAKGKRGDKITEEERISAHQDPKKITSISEEVLSFTIEVLKEENVAVCHSPYEADWQLLQC